MVIVFLVFGVIKFIKLQIKLIDQNGGNWVGNK